MASHPEDSPGSTRKEVENVYRIEQEHLVSIRQRQLLREAEQARWSARIHRPEPRVDQRVMHALSLRFQLAR